MDQILPQEYRDYRRHPRDLTDLIPSAKNTELTTRMWYRTTMTSLARHAVSHFVTECEVWNALLPLIVLYFVLTFSTIGQPQC